MKKFDVLVHKVFTSPDGEELFRQLYDQYVHQQVFDPDPLVMAKKAGEHDLIIHLAGVIEHGGRRDSSGS